MTMYLPNPDVRPTGYEAGEFIEPPVPTRQPPANPAGEQLQFLHELVEENASISGNVLQVTNNLWAIHGFIPVDGEVLMAEFDSYDQATNALEQISPRQRGLDES